MELNEIVKNLNRKWITQFINKSSQKKFRYSEIRQYNAIKPTMLGFKQNFRAGKSLIFWFGLLNEWIIFLLAILVKEVQGMIVKFKKEAYQRWKINVSGPRQTGAKG